jgi:hypothetical protein
VHTFALTTILVRKLKKQILPLLVVTPPPTDTKQELLYNEIERLMKAFKGHRCALDFDRGLVNSQLREASEARRSGDDEEM